MARNCYQQDFRSAASFGLGGPASAELRTGMQESASKPPQAICKTLCKIIMNNMSYDLMVFEKDSAPGNRKDFIKWFHDQTNWSEEHDYNDPSLTSDSLRNWFLEMINTFPAMNGPHANKELDDEHITGYSIGRDSIYIDFRWSVAEKAYKTVIELARKHDLGFFDVSGVNGDILIPSNGKLGYTDKQNLNTDHIDYALVTTTRKRPWWKFWIKKQKIRNEKLA
jgi:hypothetical protein